MRGTRCLDDAERRAVLRANLLSLMLHDPASVDPLALYLQGTNGRRGQLPAETFVLPDKLVKVLPRVAVQLDAIWGEFDQPHPDPTAQANVLRRFDPGLALRVIPGAGHWSMYEKPAAFDDAVLGLLSQPLRPRRHA